MTGSVSKLKHWIGGTSDAGAPGVVMRDHTQIVTPLSVPVDAGGDGFANASVIAAGLVLEGPVSGVGPLVIAGAVHGDVRIKGNVLLLPSAWVEGSVTGGHVEIHGRVEGRVDAGVLTLRCGGHVVGDVTCAELHVDGGGRLDGRCSMDAGGPTLESLSSPPPFGILAG